MPSLQFHSPPSRVAVVAQPLQSVDGKPTKAMSIPAFLTSRVFSCLLVLGIAVGLVVGFVATKGSPVVREPFFLIEYPGTLFLQAMVLMVPFLEVCSVSLAAAQLGSKLTLKALGICAAYTMATQGTAQAIALILSLILKPGEQTRPLLEKAPSARASTGAVFDAVLMFFRSMFPNSIVDAFVFTWGEALLVDDGHPKEADMSTFKVIFGFNSFGLITFALFLGVVLAERSVDDQIVFDILETFTRVFFRLSTVLTWVSPVAAAFLTAAFVMRMSDVKSIYNNQSSYMAVLALTCLFQLLVVYPCVYRYCVRAKGLQLFRRIANTLFIPMFTTSSLISLPVTMTSMENCEWIDSRVVRLVLPVLTKFRMDTSGASRMTQALSIAQSQHVSPSLSNYIFLMLTTFLASLMVYGMRVGEPYTNTRIVLNSLPIMVPLDGSVYERGIHLLDPLLTLAKVSGDCVGVAVVQSLMSKHLAAAAAQESTAKAKPHAVFGDCDVQIEPYMPKETTPSEPQSPKENLRGSPGARKPKRNREPQPLEKPFHSS